MDEVAKADFSTSQERTERGGVLPRGVGCVRRIFSSYADTWRIPITIPA
jgi:hypothetical protein